jgi:hypothetical protein
MIKDKFLLSKAVKLTLSSSFISIVISMCLLVNLFTPGFSTIIKSKGSAFPCEHHTCGCKTASDCLDHCCCVKEKSTFDMKCLLKKDSKGAFSTFIQSLACAGVPDQFTAVSHNLSLPEDGISCPNLYRFYYMKMLRPVFPASIKISPPDKPPRIT